LGSAGAWQIPHSCYRQHVISNRIHNPWPASKFTRQEAYISVARSLDDKNVSGINSIPVITSERSSRIFSLEATAQMCLRYFNCNYLQFRNKYRTLGSSTLIQIFHQNIRHLRRKNDELINSLGTDNINPYILYKSKHHMAEQDLLHITLSGYILGSSFCRQNIQMGGVYIFVR